MRRATLVLALCLFPAVGLLIPLATLEAQLQPGQRVRITAPNLGISKHSGILVAADGDTLTVDTLRVALMNVTRLDVHRGRKSRVAAGLGIGALTGAATLAVIGASLNICQREDLEASCAGIGAGVGAVGGSLVGLVIGAVIKTDRWEEVPLDRLRVSFGPQRDGRFGLGLSVRF